MNEQPVAKHFVNHFVIIPSLFVISTEFFNNFHKLFLYERSFVLYLNLRIYYHILILLPSCIHILITFNVIEVYHIR